MSMSLKKTLSFLLVAAAFALVPARADAKLRVVATIETLADLARQVGGDRVEVTPLSRGYIPASAPH